MTDKAQSRAIALALKTADDIEAGRDIVLAEAAASLRYLAFQVEDYRAALAEEREHTEGLTKDCEEMVRRLERLDHHLRHGIVSEVARKLADYAGGFADYDLGVAYDERDKPPPDPFPDPKPEPKKRRRKVAPC